MFYRTPYFVPGLSMILDKCKVASRQTISEKVFREKRYFYILLKVILAAKYKI